MRIVKQLLVFLIAHLFCLVCLSPLIVYSQQDFVIEEIDLPEPLQKCIETYKSLNGYRAHVEIGQHVHGPDIDRPSNFEYFIAVNKPNQLLYTNVNDSNGFVIELFSDGNTYIIYHNLWKQYVQTESPANLTINDIFYLNKDFVASIFLSSDPLQHLMNGLTNVEEVSSEDPDEKDVAVLDIYKTLQSIDSLVIPGETIDDVIIPIRIWISKTDHLIRKISYEFNLNEILKATTEQTRNEMEQYYKDISVHFFEEYNNMQADPTFSEDFFEFTPPDGSKLVEDFIDPDEGKTKDLTGQLAPDFTLTDLDGKGCTLSELKGEIVILDFWATWCGPCVRAMPHIQKLSEKYKEKGVIVLGVNTWESDQSKVKPFIEQNRYTYRILLDTNNKVVSDYGVTGIPTFFIIDKKGIIRHYAVGMGEDASEIEQKLDELIAE